MAVASVSVNAESNRLGSRVHFIGNIKTRVQCIRYLANNWNFLKKRRHSIDYLSCHWDNLATQNTVRIRKLVSNLLCRVSYPVPKNAIRIRKLVLNLLCRVRHTVS